MITELTKEQIDIIPKYVDEWTKIGLDTEHANRELAEKLMDAIYKVGGFSPPKKIWVDSPFKAIDKIRELGHEPEISNFCYGSNDAGWLSFCSYLKNELKLDCIDPIEPTIDISKVCGWYYPFDELCIMCEKPLEIHMKDKRLHNENGPSIKFRCGEEIYHLNGVRVPKDLVMTPWDKLDPKLVVKEENAEIRREIVRKIGVERIVEKLGAETVDQKDDYELILLDIGDGNKRPYLKMMNPSIGTYHIEGVHPDCKTVDAALEWRNQTNEKPEIQT